MAKCSSCRKLKGNMQTQGQVFSAKNHPYSEPNKHNLVKKAIFLWDFAQSFHKIKKKNQTPEYCI